ncbi:unnamed protein product [Symbiodinium sp. CCMP2592]|nr:unnamed protein product [Symbiodinium sp. CCMP2592]
MGLAHAEGSPELPPLPHGTQEDSIEVDDSLSEDEPTGGVGDIPLEPKVPVPIPPRRRNSPKDPPESSQDSQEHIPGPATVNMDVDKAPRVHAHHTGVLESLMSRKTDRDRDGGKESSGSDVARKPPPPKIARIDAPEFGGESKPRRSTEYYDLEVEAKKEDPGDDELRGASVPTNRHRRGDRSTFGNDTPPWVGALEGRILAHLEPLKTDVSEINVRNVDMHRELVHISSEFKEHAVRLDGHDAVLKEHTERTDAHSLRIAALEREVRDLRNSASRSPTPTRGPLTPPRSPRQGSITPQRERNIDEELQLAIGGWADCKRDDAIEEAKAMFEAAKMDHAWADIWSPYTRTSHVRVSLRFPDTHKTIPQQRAFQTEVLEALKKKKYLSSVPGQECMEIWVNRHRTPEERSKIRAVVSVKEFIEQLTFAEGKKKQPAELDWRGKLFVGNINILGPPEQADQVAEHDLLLADPKGNHSGWFIRGDKFQLATGCKAEDLQTLWENRDVARCWDLVGGEGVDFFAFQEGSYIMRAGGQSKAATGPSGNADPVTAEEIHNTPAYDPLQPQLHNWANCFFRYWGHAARYCDFDWRPIQKMISFRDHDWLESNPQAKRAPGYWPDSVRWIQLAWQDAGHLGNWLTQAQDRELWKSFIADWIGHHFEHSTGYFPDLTRVELLGRSLLQACIRVSSDGSSKEYKGGAGHRIEFQCDSFHVLQILSDAIITTANLAEVCLLKKEWSFLQDSIQIAHVRAHQGDPLNELADATAKHAVRLMHSRIVYRSWDYGLSKFTEDSFTIPRSSEAYPWTALAMLLALLSLSALGLMVRKLHGQFKDILHALHVVQLKMEAFATPVLLQEGPAVFPESVKLEIDKAYIKLWKQARDTQALVLRVQADADKRFVRYEKVLDKLIQAVVDLHPVGDKLQDSVTEVFNVLEDIFTQEERVFATHTSQMIAALDRLKYIVHELLDKSEKRAVKAQTMGTDLHKAVVAVLNQNHRILDDLEFKLGAEVRRTQGLIGAHADYSQLQVYLQETVGPLQRQLDLLIRHDTATTASSSMPMGTSSPPPPPPAVDTYDTYDPAREAVQDGTSGEHWVTLDDGTSLSVRPEC